MKEKLVRDKIPLQVPGEYRKCNSEEKHKLLRKKLVEEAIEYLIDPSPEELADVLEVVLELLKINGPKVIDALIEKRALRGAFEDCWTMRTD